MFRNLFKVDGPVTEFFAKVFNLFYLNLLTLVLCLPVITAGAAFTALDYCALKIIRDREGAVTKEYFHSFKQNFKEATLIWLIYLAVILVGVLDFVILRRSGMGAAFLVLFAILALILLVGMAYTFAFLSRYTDPIGKTLKNAWLTGLIRLPRSLALAILLLVWGLLLYSFWLYLMPLMVMFGFSVPAVIIMALLNRVFKEMEGDQ